MLEPRIRIAFVIALALATCSCARPSDPSRHLVAWWKFDDAAGAVAADASGHANDGRIVAGAWGAGRSGGALEMPGGNTGIVIVPMSPSLRSTAHEITLMAWTYRTATHNVAIVSHGYPALFFGFHGAQFKWSFRRANGRMTSCYADPSHAADLDRWIHVAATYDGWVARLYADGVEICRRWSFGDIDMPDAALTLSGYMDGSGHIVDEITGRLDDVQIYDAALTANQIRELAGIR